ncbi:methylamine utilization protein MauE [Mucilaginibacter yixingensis]|uniref:Methylamine utilization protein MauE n=1 Tax=Mucilaginibacter yixingensis TaxID=1295612 RepID=A0A2T5J4D6_9SPHI|nr:MauE/DoxX family redox-associated membrane protein [Mucilaginibacter yixingensis]PTQ92136.1 methylamine utilization protein MauE [Mucilaginibacter yixingensis]
MKTQQQNPKPNPWLIETTAWLLALLFIFTAASKLMDMHHFIQQIDNQPFDNHFTPFLVIGLPVAELATALLLFIPKVRTTGLWLSAIMMTTFTVYVALVTFHFFDRVPCACAGVFNRMSWTQHLIFNIVFTAIAIYGILLQKQTPESN